MDQDLIQSLVATSAFFSAGFLGTIVYILGRIMNIQLDRLQLLKKREFDRRQKERDRIYGDSLSGKPRPAPPVAEKVAECGLISSSIKKS